MAKITLLATELYNIFDSSDEDDNEDLELIAALLYKQRPKRTVIFEPEVSTYVQEMFDDQEFRNHFRMKRETFEKILMLLAPKIAPGENEIAMGRHRTSAEKQLLMTLWIFATQDCYRSVADRFGVGKATSVSAVRRVVQELQGMADTFITWPNSSEATKYAKVFKSESKFPGILGAIDSTHIPINIPKDNHDAYVDKNGDHSSIQLQAVCNQHNLFLHCYVGRAKSFRDQRIFHGSEVKDFLEDDSKFPGDTHLIGDITYPLHERLMVPYWDDGDLTQQQKNYNLIQASARIAIDKTFAQLKGRFRRLQHSSPTPRYDLIPQFIMTCCVLHNICVLSGDLLDDVPLAIRIGDTPDNVIIGIGSDLARSKRELIANTLPNRLKYFSEDF